jgi:hypothetical protein
MPRQNQPAAAEQAQAVPANPANPANPDGVRGTDR